MKKDELKILIGDDSALTRKQMQDALSELGCKVFFLAKDGEEVVAMYKQHEPDLVFLDIVMPNCDGIEATRQIIAEYPHADIIMASTVGTQGQLKEAINAGAKDFIQKPVKLEQLKHVIDTRTGVN
jgi:two-component system chemotaxis response regulator CheY